MTVTAGGYILVVPLHRRADLLWARDIDGRLAEPVARFAHSPRAMVQYKAMEKGTDQHEFRWTTGDQFCEEIARVEAIVAQLKAIPPSADPDGFRFSDNPFFLKFCPRVVFNPDDKVCSKASICRSTC